MVIAKQGQAALEFLMNYSWTILVLFAALGTMVYFGVLDPSNMLPEICSGPAGLVCDDKPSIYSGSPGAIKMAFTNNIGQTITIKNGADMSNSTKFTTLMGSCHTTSIEFRGSDGQKTCTTSGIVNSSCTYGPGSNIVATITCSNNEPQKGRFKGQLDFAITNSESGLSHPAKISILGNGNN